ncbi:glycerophosphodiester phosphodiesterase [Simiduia sp. 21SJ11W-1]|uniref:glycerophosphodiester phosphodiesterase n=1 Tax=Simiduia sp. 21SJ11W-1 TaxID=2909669 RepID=UPI00209DD026|nr:glycerophosphodiester phosphodiesterase [Simiduia sp. 21SJ11W-1]UTA46605.1 glycerophosphodiester phosphodiesterase [Simiduia sp. 21SJ11W-1]
MGRFLKGFVVTLAVLACVYSVLRFMVPVAAVSHSYFDNTAFEVIAHGAGQGLQPKNTLEAALMADRVDADIIEIDIHASVDGVLVLSHDDTVDDMTNGTGLIREKTFAELQALDAAQGFRRDEGAPLAGTGVKIPALADVFTALPHARYIIEIKQLTPSIAEQLCELVRAHKLSSQVLVGSFFTGPLAAFRAACPEVATSMSQDEVTNLVLLQKLRLAHLYDVPGVALQVPVASGGIEIVNESFVADMHAQGLKVHVWTINDIDEMRRLIALGVDGIITDYPDRLHRVLVTQGH